MAQAWNPDSLWWLDTGLLGDKRCALARGMTNVFD
jgi:hypothetical protein